MRPVARIPGVLAGLGADDWTRLLDLLHACEASVEAEDVTGHLLEFMHGDGFTAPAGLAAAWMAAAARRARSATDLMRADAAREFGQIKEFLLSCSPDCASHGTASRVDEQRLHELLAIASRCGVGPRDLRNWREQITCGRRTLDDLEDFVRQEESIVRDERIDPRGAAVPGFDVMGTGRFVTAAQWAQQRRRVLGQPVSAVADQGGTLASASACAEPGVRVSVITSLYRGGAHIARFMENITSQEGFAACCELIIVDAASPDGEGPTIAGYLDRMPNVRYERLPSRVGIYEAWNIACRLARGEYLTSANVDDLRRPDSLALQAQTLQAMPFVDVVYQDFFYTLDPELAWSSIERMGYLSCLPPVTPASLMCMNPPHNAPMWRRRLHDEVGMFDESYESAGDYDFWMRCLAAGKRFFKISDPHVAYFQNPEGLSTRPQSRGHLETRQIRRRHGPGLVSTRLLESGSDFHRHLDRFPTLCPRQAADRQRLVGDALRQLARGPKFAEGT